ncbi:hypothetical protein [Flavobacterium sp.]|uniref:hypothetical protein n=1 Tax=Flavobacterium sp. TaxID=239 RepID=UPI0028BD2B3F|nr:hypothetical protein [Flavobacterium sp.]
MRIFFLNKLLVNEKNINKFFSNQQHESVLSEALKSFVGLMVSIVCRQNALGLFLGKFWR